VVACPGSLRTLERLCNMVIPFVDYGRSTKTDESWLASNGSTANKM
jgi:hypothetical protein